MGIKRLNKSLPTTNKKYHTAENDQELINLE